MKNLILLQKFLAHQVALSYDDASYLIDQETITKASEAIQVAGLPCPWAEDSKRWKAEAEAHAKAIDDKVKSKAKAEAEGLFAELSPAEIASGRVKPMTVYNLSEMVGKRFNEGYFFSPIK